MEKLCKYQEIQGVMAIGRRLRCCNCGYVTEKTRVPLETFQEQNPRVCTSTFDRIPVPLPNILKRLLRYATYELLRNHKASPDVVILERFSKCSSCENYNDSAGACGVCGCAVNLLRMSEGRNKLADQEQDCPLPEPQKKWHKIS